MRRCRHKSRPVVGKPGFSRRLFKLNCIPRPKRRLPLDLLRRQSVDIAARRVRRVIARPQPLLRASQKRGVILAVEPRYIGRIGRVDGRDTRKGSLHRANACPRVCKSAPLQVLPLSERLSGHKPGIWPHAHQVIAERSLVDRTVRSRRIQQGIAPGLLRLE